LGQQNAGAEDERGCDCDADDLRRRAAMDARPMNRGVASAARDEPAVDGQRERAGDGE
jgi:hypothetical protein